MRIAALLTVPLLVACAAASPSPSPSPGSIATPSPAASAVSTPTATPGISASPSPLAPLLEFPDTTGVELAPGRYSGQPPFDIPITFEIADSGWGSAHLHGDFLDVIQPARVGVPPTRWVAFALPETLHGATELPAQGTSPAAAIAAFAARDQLTVTDPEPYSIAGLEGLAADISTDASGLDLFGGPGGDLQLDPAYDLRLIAVPYAESLFLALVFAPQGELAQAWQVSQPIIDSIVLPEQ
jgi:hypothetical protein